MNLDYLPYMRDRLVQPLITQGSDGVQEVVDLMDAYYLMKEDFDNIMEICSWGGKPSPFTKVDPKVRNKQINHVFLELCVTLIINNMRKCLHVGLAKCRLP